jgi:hypothetical protein
MTVENLNLQRDNLCYDTDMITVRTILLRLGAELLLFALLGSSYVFLIRPAQLHWGATPEEIARTMPDDSTVAHPAFDATRAITIRGTPEQIWPWLAQMGFRRAGFYGYDLIENLGSGTGIRSAATILPRFQQPRPGDALPLSVAGSLTFAIVQPNSCVVWRSWEEPAHGVFIWELVPIDQSRTRLISRIRWSYLTGAWGQTLGVFTEFSDHVAVRKILAGVRDRVEGRAPEPLALEAIAISGWLLGFLEFSMAAVTVLCMRHWRAAWLFALGAGALLQFTLYSSAPLWICASLPWVYLLGSIWWMRRYRVRRVEQRQSLVAQ